MPLNGAELRGCLNPTAQHFSHAPRLRNTPTRYEGLIGIKNFTDGSHPGFSQMGSKSFQEDARSGEVVAMNFQPCVNKRSNQPSPDGSLMVSRISGAQIAKISRFVIRMTRSQRA